MAIKRLRIDEGTSVSSFSERSGVYFLYSGSVLLYVGKSNNIKRRMCDHLGSVLVKTESELSFVLGNSLKRARSKIQLEHANTEFSEYSKICYVIDYIEVLYESNENISELESYYIRKFKPPFNEKENGNFMNQVETRNFYRALSKVNIKKADLIGGELGALYTIGSLYAALQQKEAC